MMSRFCKLLVVVIGLSISPGVGATTVTITGKIIYTEGHQNPACRTIGLREAGTGTVYAFRTPDMSGENSILAIAITAQVTGLQTSITYDTGVTSGCGTEPKISYIHMSSP